MEKIWKDEYVNLIGDMKFSARQKEKMVHFLVNAAEQEEGMDMNRAEKNKTGISPSLRRLAIAGICICILAAGTAVAGAAGLLKPVSEIFGNTLKLDKNTSEIVDKMGKNLHVTDNSAGMAITADAVIGDEYNYAVVFTLKSKDGTPFQNMMENTPADTWCFESKSLEIKPSLSNWASWEDSDFHCVSSADASPQFVFIASLDNKINDKELTFGFSNLGYKDGNEFVKVLEGDWELKLKMDFPDTTVKLQAGQHLQTRGLNMVIQSVKISPLGYHIEFKDLDYKKGDTITDTDKDFAFSELPVTLNLANGKKIKLQGGSSVMASEKGFDYTHGGRFGKILPMEQMESIRIGDVVIKIPAAH